MKKIVKRTVAVFVFFMVIGLFAAYLSGSVMATGNEEVPRFDTIEAAATYLRDGFINRSFEGDEESPEYTQVAWVEIPAQSMTNEELSDTFWNAISSHTGNPQGGDYMKYNASAYVWDVVKGETYWSVKVIYAWNFTHEENTQLNLAVSTLLEELNLDDLSDYEKVRAIYDWMCLNIEYDYTYTGFTAYDALCKRRVTCQGYASLFYRLCLEVGVDCRYCGGYAAFMGHGWNLVKIEGNYYFVDTTWGAGGVPNYAYFLKGINGMDDHLIIQERWELDLGDDYMPAENDYPIPEKTAIYCQGKVGNIEYTLNRVGELTLEGEGEILAEEWRDLGLSSVNAFWTDDLGTNMCVAFPTRSIKIGEGITKIEAGALYLPGVIRAELPESLTYLGKGNFENVFNLHISKNLTTIEYGAIRSRNLNRLTVDSENPSYSAVDNCLYTKDKKTLLCYGGLTEELEGGTFGGVYKTSFSIPDGVVEIAPESFYSQHILDFISIPDTAQIIGERAFYQCIPANFDTLLGEEKTLTLQMSDGVSVIEKEAFLESAIEEIYSGKDVTYIGERSLGSSCLKTIEIHPENANYCVEDGVLFDKSKEILIRYPVMNGDATYVVPDGVKEVGAGAFERSSSELAKGVNLVKVEFPESLETIGSYAFMDQMHLEDIGYASGLKVIGKGAFLRCSGLETIVIPDSVERVEAFAFMNNKSNEIHIGMDVNFIGKGAFQRREIPEENAAVYEVYFQGETPETIEADRDYIPFGYFEMYGNGFDGSVHTKIYFPVEEHVAWNPYGNNQWIYDPGWDYVNNNAARNLKYPIAAYHIGDDETVHVFESETDGSQITYICTQCDVTHVFAVEENPDDQEVDPGLIFEEAGEHLFIIGYEGNSQELMIPEEVDGKVVTQIMEGAFRNCGSLERVIMSDTITDIWHEAFEGCDNLKNVDISKSVTWIGNRVFDNCPELLAINVHTDNTVYFSDSRGVLYQKGADKIILFRAPETLSGDYEILDGTWLIGSDSFENCRGVSSIVIPEGVIEISSAFRNCGITAITIPATVTSLGSYLFAESALDEINVKEVVFQGDAPSVMGEYAFRFVEGLTVYYPADNVTWTADVMQDYGGSVIWKPYGAGVTVSGTITSYNDNTAEVTVELLDESNEVAYSVTTTGNNASYSIADVVSGSYILRVSKVNHVTRSCEITVGETDIMQDVTLVPVGDLTGDGKVTATDYSRLFAHVKKTSNITDEYVLSSADVTGDGKITATDYSRLLAHVKKVSLLW